MLVRQVFYSESGFLEKLSKESYFPLIVTYFGAIG